MAYYLDIARFDYDYDYDYDVGFIVEFDELEGAIRSAKGIWKMLTPEAKDAFINRRFPSNRIRVLDDKKVVYCPYSEKKEE